MKLVKKGLKFFGWITFTARNLLFISKEYNTKKDPLLSEDDAAELINLVIELYYTNSFITPHSQKNEFTKIIKEAIKDKPKFKPDIQKSTFENYREIASILIQIQNASEGQEYKDFNLKDFIIKCMDVKIEEIDNDFIILNIQNTLNLLDYSKEINLDQFQIY